MRGGLVTGLLLLAACGARSSLDGLDASAPDLAAPDLAPPDLGAPDEGRPDLGAPCVPTPETCDGIDEDCDGVIDDGTVCLSVDGVEGPSELLDPIAPQPETFCGPVWFGYGFPDMSSANPEPDVRREDAVVVAMQRGATCAGPYVAVIADTAEDDDGGVLGLTWTSEFDALPVLGDEPTECVDRGGEGFCEFRWAPCCTDGVLLGPFPESGCVRITVFERPTDPEIGPFVLDSFVVVDGAGNAFPFVPSEALEICAEITPPAG
ncbi:MAG: hypothetical protein AAGH15_02395 [Myxococcota bacterium]